MPVFLLNQNHERAPQQPIKVALNKAIPELIEVPSLDALLAAVAKSKLEEPTVSIVLLPSGQDGHFDQLVEFIDQHRAELFFILIGGEISASEYKRLVRSGAADWTPAQTDLSEVLDIIARRPYGHDPRLDPQRGSGQQAIRISFIPSSGGIGNTTLATEVAAYLKNDKTTRLRSVCIVDLDFQTSHLCDYLDSEPRLQIAELSSAPERLDEHL
ncbi:MAG: hypothetical protein WCA56_03120, partial [Xanthobacteraceae bacterium]